MATCWLNGQIVSKENAVVSVFDHGVLYGDGVFEGIRFYHNRIFRLDAHLKRLEDSGLRFYWIFNIHEKSLSALSMKWLVHMKRVMVIFV